MKTILILMTTVSLASSADVCFDDTTKLLQDSYALSKADDQDEQLRLLGEIFHDVSKLYDSCGSLGAFTEALFNHLNEEG